MELAVEKYRVEIELYQNGLNAAQNTNAESAAEYQADSDEKEEF